MALTALGGLGTIPFVGKEVIQASEEERAEPALFRPHATQKALAQQMCDKALRQILGVFVTKATSSHVGVEGVPVSAAQLFQGGRCLRIGALARRQHHAPVRGGEYDPVRLGLGISFFRSHGSIQPYSGDIARPFDAGPGLVSSLSARFLLRWSKWTKICRSEEPKIGPKPSPNPTVLVHFRTKMWHSPISSRHRRSCDTRFPQATICRRFRSLREKISSGAGGC